MVREIRFPDNLSVDPEELLSWMFFLQLMSNRRIVGGLRYGRPKKKQRYLTRLALELRAYRQTGNFEHLINIAVYCWLESEAPQNPKFHFDPLVDSATRHELGGSIA